MSLLEMYLSHIHFLQFSSYINNYFREESFVAEDSTLIHALSISIEMTLHEHYHWWNQPTGNWRLVAIVCTRVIQFSWGTQCPSSASGRCSYAIRYQWWLFSRHYVTDLSLPLGSSALYPTKCTSARDPRLSLLKQELKFRHFNFCVIADHFFYFHGHKPSFGYDFNAYRSFFI